MAPPFGSNSPALTGHDVGVDEDDAERILVIPTGCANDQALLDRDFWLSPFWFGALYAMKPMAQPAMVKMNAHRIIHDPDEVREEDMAKFIYEQPLIFSERGAEVGKIYGESKVGEAIGLRIGTLHVITVLCLQLHQMCSRVKDFFEKIFVNIGVSGSVNK